MIKKYYLYRQPLVAGGDQKDLRGNNGTWWFDDEFTSHDAAIRQATANAKNGSWKVWKIEEVMVFD